MRRVKFQWWGLLLTMFLMSSCHEELFELDRISDEIELEPRLVAPIVYGHLSMDDLTALFDSADYVGEFDNGLIYVAYNDNLLSVSADTAINIPDIKTSELYVDSDAEFDVFLPVPVGDTFVTQTRVKVVDFSLEGDSRVDEVLVQDGTIVIDVRCSFHHEGILVLGSQEIIDNHGNYFSQTIQISSSDGNFETRVEFPSDSFTIIPSVINDTSFIFMDFDLALINSGAPISPGEECTVQASFLDMDFYRVYGFVDAGDLVDYSDVLEIPIYRDNPDLAAIQLADPRINIISSSSVGVPFEIDLDSMIAVDKDGGEVPLQFTEGNTLEFLAPGMDQQGETVTTTIEINNTTSNIRDFVNAAPVEILYSIEGRTTTTGEDTSHFVLKESRLDLDIELLVPLDFRSTGYGLTDTMEFSLGDNGVDTSIVKNAEVSLLTVNELPIELLVQVYFLDDAGMVLDSVFDDNLPVLGASIVDPETGITVEGREEINTVEFPAEKLARLGEAADMILKARMTTSNDGVPFVKILSSYTLDFKVSVLADVALNTRNL